MPIRVYAPPGQVFTTRTDVAIDDDGVELDRSNGIVNAVLSRRLLTYDEDGPTPSGPISGAASASITEVAASAAGAVLTPITSAAAAQLPELVASASGAVLTPITGAGAASLELTASGSGQSSAALGFISLSGRHLIDGASNVFIPRGPELIVDEPSDIDVVDAIAATGANALRMLITLDVTNNQTPAVYSAIIGRAVELGMVVWLSLFSWDDNAVPPRAIAAAFGGGTLAQRSDYLDVWQRQWLKDIVALYDGWIVLDAMQEFIASSTPAEGAPAIAEWVAAAKTHIQFFRTQGYTQPLDVMTAFEGRDLASIVENAAEILAVDTVTVNGTKQTMFGWQAYWGDDWYRGWQGGRLLGSGLITASQAVTQFVATRDYKIMIGLDSIDIPGDEAWNSIMPTCHAQNVGWLWWEWFELSPASGNPHGTIVRTRLPDGFAGAVLAAP